MALQVSSSSRLLNQQQQPRPDDVLEIAWTPITKEMAASIVQLILADDDDGAAGSSAAAAYGISSAALSNNHPSTSGGTSGSKRIRVIDLIDNRLGPKLTEMIAVALEASPTVDEIAVRFNNIGRLGCDAIASVVNISPRLRLLDLRGNGLSAMDCRKLFKCVSLSTSLQYLGISNNTLGAEGAALVATALEKNSFVTSLDISMNRIGAEGMTAIAATLLQPGHPLRVLNVWGNHLGPKGAEVLLEGAQRHGALVSVSAGNNNAGSDGEIAGRLAALVARGGPLKSLEWRCNGLTSHALKAVGEALSGSTSTVEQLSLGGNFFGGSGVHYHGIDALVKGLVHNKALQSLDLASCELGAAECSRIAATIATSPSLHTLDLSNNACGDEGAAAIAKAILASKSLTSLDLTDNKITSQSIADVLEAIQANHRLVHVSLHGNDTSRVIQRKVDALLEERQEDRARVLLSQQQQAQQLVAAAREVS